VKELSVQRIVLDVVFASLRKFLPMMHQKLTMLHGMLTNMLDAYVMLDSEDQTALFKNVHLDLISYLDKVMLKEEIALGVESAITTKDFANVSLDIMELDVNSKLSLVKSLSFNLV